MSIPRTTALTRRRKALGICTLCNERAELNRTMCRKHLDRENARRAGYSADGRCRCGNPSSTHTCADCSARFKALNRALKLSVLTHYSSGKPECACCGESIVDFLSIDHINNDGAAHRKEIGQSKLYGWLKKNKYPAGYQVLCMNCNFGKGINGGVCPHKTHSAVDTKSD